jgi:ribosome biogenesis GTPase
MTTADLGYTQELETYRKENKLDSFDVGRVISEHKGRYVVSTGEKEYDAEIIGHLRFTAVERADFPAVGDWVAIMEYDTDKALIHAIFPRKTMLERQAVGKQGEKQIIATNINFAFIVQAVDNNFNLNRIERYLAICNASNVAPIILLNKTDLLDDAELSSLYKQVKGRVKNVPIFLISNETNHGIPELKSQMTKGKTYCLLGSSGVGKSSLLNSLAGKTLMETNTISESSQKGRHVTSHRELVVLDNGAMIIDNPGMREVGIADSATGLDITFDAIHEAAERCKFKDCTHTAESGCAVLEGVKNGQIDESAYQNYLKMEKEREHFEATIAERRKKDKAFGRMVKNIKEIKGLNKG